MIDTYSVKLNGEEIARLTGDGISAAKKLKSYSQMETEYVDDPKMLRLKRDGKTLLVFSVSADVNLTVEKVSE